MEIYNRQQMLGHFQKPLLTTLIVTSSDIKSGIFGNITSIGTYWNIKMRALYAFHGNLIGFFFWNLGTLTTSKTGFSTFILDMGKNKNSNHKIMVGFWKLENGPNSNL